MEQFGIECISRGAKQVYFCEKSHIASNMIKQNLEKTKFLEQSIIIEKDYKKCLENLKEKNVDFDIIYIDPPYDADISVEAVKRILSLDLLKKEGIIIIETDDEKRELEELKEIDLEVYDLRNYGRVSLIFLNRKG